MNIMNRFNVAYLAFDQFVPSKHAGFVHSYSIAKAIKSIGNDVVLYGIPTGVDLYNLTRWSGEYHGLNVNYVRFIVSFKSKYRPLYPLNIISYYKTLKNLQDQDPDIVHERFHLPNPFSAKLFERLDCPKVLEINNLYVGCGVYGGRDEKKAQEQQKKHFDQSDAIITQTRTLKDMIGEVIDKPIYVVPNGVDTKKFDPDHSSEELRKELGLEEDQIVVTFLGSFRKWHGAQFISKMADLLKDKKVVFLLIGGGELFDEIDRGRRENMILTGPMEYDAVPKYLASSDILIAPFDINYFGDRDFWWNPVKLFEYMASGKPVVSYDLFEIRQIVRDAGLLAEAGKIDDFIKNIDCLVEDENLRRRLGSRGREIALNEYDWEKRARDVVKIYQTL
jgi:glycosyltransferase involved in cell wall biosynthesis